MAERLAKDLGSGEWIGSQKFMAEIAEAEMDGQSILLIKPTTFMNRSGECIRKIIDFYKLDPAKQILVCCDDVDLPLGTHRLRMNGGPGTHNGLKSIVDCIGEGFPRLRIGFGPQPEHIDLAAWVLSGMTAEEKKMLEPSVNYAKIAVQEILKNNKRL